MRSLRFLLTQNPEPFPFDRMHEAVKNKNVNGVLRALSSATIDVYNGKEGCPLITLLAAKYDDFDFVHFLMKFNASPLWLMQGLAQNKERRPLAYLHLEKLIKDPNLKNLALLYFARGLSVSGDDDEIYTFFDNVVRDHPEQINGVLDFIAYGLGFGGHTQKIYRDKDQTDSRLTFLEKIQHEHPDRVSCILRQIAYGFAQGGHKAKAYAFLEKVKNEYPAEIAKVLNSIAEGFAARGDDAEAYACLEKAPADQTHSMLDRIAFGLGLYGDKTKTELFLLKVKNDLLSCSRLTNVLDQLIRGCGMGGHKALLYALFATVTTEHAHRLSYALEKIAYGLARGRHMKEAFHFLDWVQKVYPAHLKHVFEQLIYAFALSGCITDMYALFETVVDKHPALIDSALFHIAYGLALNGFITEMYTCWDTVKNSYHDHFNAALNEMALALGRAGDMKNISSFLTKLKLLHPTPHYLSPLKSVLEKMTASLIQYGNNKKMQEFLELVRIEHSAYTPNVLEWIACAEEKAGQCIDASLVLKTMTLIEDSGRRQQASTLLRDHVTFNITDLTSKASEFNSMMGKQKLTYDQLIASTQLDFRIFLLQGVALHQGKLSPFILLSIAAFLSPLPIRDFCDLKNKFALKTCRVEFFKDASTLKTLPLTEACMVPLREEERASKKRKTLGS